MSEKCWECKVNDIPDPIYCCDGHMCGCYGYPIEPPFCDECYEKLMERSKNFPIDHST